MRLHPRRTLAYALGVLLMSGCATADNRDEVEAADRQFCDTAWAIVGAEHAVDYGDIRLLVGQPVSLQSQCGDGLKSFSPESLAPVDGVLFNDCSIHLKDGSKTTANEQSIQCEPLPLEAQNEMQPPP